MAINSRQVQTQAQQQVQTLSPQQILAVKLLELPTVELEERIHSELLDNPALEEGKEHTEEAEYAAQMAAQDCAKVAFDLGLRKVKAYVKGPGNGRESAIRTVHGAGIEVTEIIDVTPLPHNGCRPPKRRRV